MYNGDRPSLGFAILSFLIPLLGLILWLAWRDRLPRRARSCGKGALISVVTSIVLTVLLLVVYCAIFAAVVDTTIGGLTFVL